MLYCNFAGVPYTGADRNELDVVTFLIGDATGEKEVALGTRIQIVRATPSSAFLFVEMEVLIFFRTLMSQFGRGFPLFLFQGLMILKMFCKNYGPVYDQLRIFKREK